MSDAWKPELSTWKARFPELTWWLDTESAKARLVGRDMLGWEHEPELVLDRSTQQLWVQDTHVTGRIAPRRTQLKNVSAKSWAEAKKEVKYAAWQYELIAWCIQKMLDEGWRSRECYEIIRHFWRHLPGQAPLVSRTVWVWWMYHLKFKKRGQLWP